MYGKDTKKGRKKKGKENQKVTTPSRMLFFVM
jgi:hypothetical protein